MLLETLENRQLFSVFTTPVVISGGVLAPPSPPPPPTGGIFLPPTNGGVLAPVGDPNFDIQNANRVVGSTLYVTGSSGPDSIDITFSAPTFTTARALVFGGGASVGGLFNGSFVVTRFSPTPSSESISTSGITRVVVVGYEGFDTFNVNANVTTPVWLLGGAGNDRLSAGSGADYVEGGPGDDILHGGNGNDSLNGGDGNDMLFGDAGDDDLRGFAGNDTLDAGSGNDTLFGMDGDDTEFGGLGADTLYGGNGDDTLVSVFGGVDSVHGDQGWDIFLADKQDILTDMDTLATSGSSYKYSDVEDDYPGTAFNALRVSYDKSTLVSVFGIGTDEGEMFDKIFNNRGKAMSITTEPSILGVNSALRPSHAYSILGTFRQGNGQKMVILRNPSDQNGSNAGTNGIVTVSASALYSSCLLLYIAK